MKIIKHIITKVFLVVVALQIINLSFDDIDFQPTSLNSESHFNDINSATEYFAEIVFSNNPNIFPDYNSSKSSKDLHRIKSVSAKTYKVPHNGLSSKNIEDYSNTFINYNASLYNQFKRDITPPPPKNIS